MGAHITTIDSRNIMLYTTDDGTVYRLGSLYYDGYYEKIWAQSHISSFRKPKYFVFGLGSGSYLRALLDVADKDAVIVVYEPDDSIYELAVSQFDAETLLNDSRVIFRQKSSYEQLITLFSSIIFFPDIDGCSICVHPNYSYIFNDQYNLFRKCIDDCGVKSIMMASTAKKSGNVIINNNFCNLKVFNSSYSIESLKHVIPPSVPLVIIASGPSLDSSIEQLKAAKGRAVLLSVDSALPTLMKHDLIPDFFISVDPIKEMDNFADPRIADIPGIFPLSCNSRIFDFHHAPKFFYNNGFLIVEYLAYKNNTKIPSIDADSSVSNHAFGIGAYLGSENIICVGLDLGYPGGMTHSKDALFGKKVSESKNEIIVETACTKGGTITTNALMDMYRKLLEQRIASYPNINVINTSYDGALINGSVYMPLEAAVNKLCPSNITITIPACKKPDTRYDLQTFFKEIISGQLDFISTLRSTLDRISSIEDMELDYDSASSIIDSCDFLNKAIGMRPDLSCISLSARMKNYKILRSIYEKTDVHETLARYHEYFTNIIDACDYVVDLEKKLFLQ